MNLAVRTYQYVSYAPSGIPPDWPAEVVELGESTTLPEGSGWQLMTPTSLAAHKAQYQSAYDAWVVTVTPVVNLPAGSPAPVKIVGSSSKEADPVYKGIIGASGITFVSHDFGDATTWYQKSVRVTDEVLTDSGDGLTFNAANDEWVNINSPRLIFLRNRVTKRDGTYSTHAAYEVAVKVNDVVQSSGYTVNYVTGAITFSTSKAGSTVKCSYSHNNGVTNKSEWILCPPAGKTYVIDHVEVQFSKNVTFVDNIRFEIWAGKTVSELTTNGWSDAWFDAGYGQMRADYQDMRGFINQGNLGVGEISAITNAGTSQPTLVFPFDYVKAIALNGDQKSLMRLVSLNDNAMTNCDIATASFYVQVVNN